MTDTLLRRPFLSILLAALLFTAAGLAGCADNGRDAAGTSVSVRKSPNDHRDYRYLVLPNALRVLLVSDPETEKAAASLSVLRGSYHEPDRYPGLAHFLEHMLFIGTEKYPEVDGYQQFIAAHGGRSNAYTAAEHTNYFFDVLPEHFPAAMDRFAQFFISPLLDAGYVAREKNAIHSEYQLQLKDDGWRGHAALRTAMDPDYPGSRFTIGSLESLGEGVGDALRTFFRENYSADQMVLVTLSSEPLDAMESWIRPTFGAIENRRIGPAPVPEAAFLPSDLPLKLTYRSLSENYQLSFNFPIPPVDEHYRSKPARFLANLLGHEGNGSLHQLLKERGWIESLGAGVNRLDTGNALLSINIELTPAGRLAIDEIRNLLFGYIELLQKTPLESWRYDEQASAASLAFRYQEQSSPTGFVYMTSPRMARVPPEDVLVADYLMDGFDRTLIGRYLERLRPDNLILEISGPDVSTDRTEPWFGVPYRLETGIRDTAKPEVADLHLPAPNPFLPEALSLIDEPTARPAVAAELPGSRLWLAPDVEFGVPRANQTFTLGIPGGLTSARDAALAEIYQRLLSDAINPYAYPAMLAGLSYQISTHAAGFRISLGGYSEKQPVLLERILETFTGLTVDPARFRRYQEEVVRNWRNFRYERPYIQTQSALGNALLDTSFAADRLADEAEALVPEDLVRWQGEKLKQVSVLGLSHGNVNAANLASVQELLKKRLPLTDFDLVQPTLRLVNEALLLEVPVEHDDAAMSLYVQDEEASFRARATSALAAQILRQAYFSSLRTEQQLGYVVSMNNRTIRNHGGLLFVVQSPVASAARLEQATLTFLREQLPVLQALDAATFAQHQNALASQLTQRARNLRERTARYQADLDENVTTFDSQERIAALVRQLELPEVVAYLRRTLNRLTHARLLVYSPGRFDEAPARGRRLRLDSADGPAARDAAGARTHHRASSMR